MTDVLSAPAPDPTPPGNRRTVIIAVVVTLAVALGLSLLVRRWVRGGGARRAITELAEEGAVMLADTLVDEILPAA